MRSNKISIAAWIGTGVIGGLLISLGINAVAQRQAPAPLPIDDLRRFAEVYGAIKGNYVEDVEDSKLIKEAVSGMLSGLDPHSTYLDATAFKELQEGTQGEFGGLGIEVGMEDGFVRVVSPIEDTPAQRAGIRAGDLIIKIDDKAVKGLDLSQAVKLMRGKPDTSIRITISRKGSPTPLEFKLVRAVIKVQSVKAKRLESGHAYIRITQFQEQSTRDVVRALNRIISEEKAASGGLPKGIVLDLRNDPGGLLNAAVGVSAAFLPEGTLVVKTDGRVPDARREFHATTTDYQRGAGDALSGLPPEARTLPMVVLVNGGSASASEIVAGALQDHGRAAILGTQTFGKGSVQTILPLSTNSAIKITTALYYTPKGRSIQATGIRPDHWVEETPEGDLSDRFRIREADLAGHLGNGNGAPEKGSGDVAGRRTASEPPPKPLEFGSAEDHQLKQAINLLTGKPVQLNEAPPETTKAKASE